MDHRRGGTAAPDEPYDAIRAGSIDGTDPEPHDHAILRALNAKCTEPPHQSAHLSALTGADRWRTDDPSQDPQIRGSARRTVFVGRLDFVTNEETLRTTFERFGPIRHLRLVRDIGTPCGASAPPKQSSTTLASLVLTRANSDGQVQRLCLRRVRTRERRTRGLPGALPSGLRYVRGWMRARARSAHVHDGRTCTVRT
jgi:hypothetical protein